MLIYIRIRTYIRTYILYIRIRIFICRRVYLLSASMYSVGVCILYIRMCVSGFLLVRWFLERNQQIYLGVLRVPQFESKPSFSAAINCSIQVIWYPPASPQPHAPSFPCQPEVASRSFCTVLVYTHPSMRASSEALERKEFSRNCQPEMFRTFKQFACNIVGSRSGIQLC